jgi:serine/threonine protein kinase
VRRLIRFSDDDDGRLRTGAPLEGEVGRQIAASVADVELASGARLGPYEVIERIGSGGMGTVYRARHRRLDRDVAIKSIAGLLAAGPDGLRRFEREARLLASLAHPNIATVHDFLIVDERPYLILELVDGEMLSERIRRGALPWPEAVRIAVELTEALAEAHGKGIVHRDLKPDNVRFTEKDRIKVLDFGLAKTVRLAGSGPPATGSFATAAMTLLGTPGYMSPEQARGEPVDARTDIWAFGCVMYEMLSGRRTFGADAIAAALRDEPDWSRLPADAPAAIADLIRSCLAKDPSQRPGRIEEVAARLRPLVTRRPPTRSSAPASRTSR